MGKQNMSQKNTTIVSHPLVQHKLSIMRDISTPTAKFRQLLREISLLLAYEVCGDLETGQVEIQTPLENAKVPKLEGKKLCFISILRAGNGLLDGMLDLVPSARVGHVGLYRDPKTLVPVEYYLKLPDQIDERLCIVVDPMLATGNSAAAAVQRIKDAGATRVKFVCLLAAPEGLTSFSEQHPDVPIVTASVDRELNDHAYILPGLGDAGDRMYGTKCLSDKPDEIDSRIDADFHASDINFIAKKLCSNRPILIGHDVGSYVLQSVGHKNPKNYSGLIFFNCPTASVGRDWVNYGHVNEIWYQSFHLTDLAQQLVGFNQHTIRLYIEYFLKHWSYNKSAFDLVLDDWVENFSQPNALIGGFSWYKSNNEKRIKTLQGDVDMPLNKISTPSAILWGKHDPILKSAWGKFVKAHFDDVFVEYANNSGHFVHVEQPELAMKFINQNAQKWLI